MALTPFDRLIRIADRLRELAAGTAAADLAIHRALGLPYTRDEAALRTLLSDGFEMFTSSRAGERIYGVVARAGDPELPAPRPVGRHAGAGDVRGAQSL